MGWQDAPVEKKSAWEAAPVVPVKPKPAPKKKPLGSTGFDQLVDVAQGAWKGINELAMATYDNPLGRRIFGEKEVEEQKKKVRGTYTAASDFLGTQRSPVANFVGNVGSTVPLAAAKAPAILGKAAPIVTRGVQGAMAGIMTRGEDQSTGEAAGIGATANVVLPPVLSAMATGVKKLIPSSVANAASEGISSVASRLGIRPTPATTGGGMSGVMQRGLGVTPGSDFVVSKAVTRETDDLAASARSTAGKLGPVSTPQGAGEAVAQGAKAYQRLTKAKGGALYDARDNLMGGKNAPVLLGSAAKEIRSFADEFPNTPLLASMREHPAVRKLGEAIPEGAEPQVTLGEATEALSHIRAALRNAERSNTITPAVKARIAKVEQAFEDDVMRVAQAADAIAGRSGEGSALAAQKAADAFWRERSTTLSGALKKPLASAKDDIAVPGTAVYKQIVGDMQREGGNMARLKKTWVSLPKGARSKFSATSFENLGRAKSGVQDELGEQWSFNTFLTNYDKMAPEARKIVFGGKGVEQEIDDIARYAARLRDIDKTRNFSNTARAGLAGVYLAAVGGQILQGDYEGAGKMLVGVPALALGGKLFMSTPAMRQWTKQALSVMTNIGASQTVEKSLERLTARLPTIAAATPAIREEVMQLHRAITQRAGVPVAAGDAEKDQQKQQ